MNWRAIKAVVRRDLLAVVRSKGVLIPLIVVPVILMILLPFAIGRFTPVMSELPGANMSDITTYTEQMPAALLVRFEGYTPEQVMIVFTLVYLFAPMFLILPLMVASVIAADSFAGEKERKTLEALIYTPTNDLERFAGKVLSAWLPALAVSLVSFVLYGLTANIGAWPTMQRIFFPNVTWIVLIFWVAPAAAALGLGATVLVSSRVNSFQEANQIAGVVVLPIVILVIAQATGVMYLSIGLTVALGVVIWLIAAALLWLGVRTFRRSEIIARS
jgi:ABC-2 type transport system permease protein